MSIFKPLMNAFKNNISSNGKAFSLAQSRILSSNAKVLPHKIHNRRARLYKAFNSSQKIIANSPNGKLNYKLSRIKNPMRKMISKSGNIKQVSRKLLSASGKYGGNKLLVAGAMTAPLFAAPAFMMQGMTNSMRSSTQSSMQRDIRYANNPRAMNRRIYGQSTKRQALSVGNHSGLSLAMSNRRHG